MAKISINVVESSSKGNCILLFDQQTYLLLDYGTNPQYLKTAFDQSNIKINQIAGCLITHYHYDHVCTLDDSELSKKIQFYCSAGTFSFLNIKNNYENFKFHIFCKNKWTKIKNTNWKFKAFPTIHNANDSCCFIVKNKRNKILYLTDTKFFINKQFKNLTGYIIESNFGSEYISSEHKLKTHYKDERNHLNLEEANNLFNYYYGNKTKFIIFSHLSKLHKNHDLINEVCWKIKQNSKIDADWINPNAINKFKKTYI